MAVQLLVLCLMVGLSAVSGQRIYRPLPSGQESLRHGPRALEIAVKTGEHVIIPISMASQVAFMQEAVQASIDCLPWLMNFPGGTIQWYRELYNEQGMPRDDRGPQLVTSFSGVRVIGGQFNQWFNITSIKITQDERDNDYGLHICEVCVARGTPLEMCHNATLNVYVAGAPPVILKAGDEGPYPLYPGQFRIGSTICYDAAMNQTFSFICNLNDNPPIAVPPPTYEWKFNDRVIFRSNTSAVDLMSPEYMAFLEANPLFGQGIVNPVIFLPQTREIIILDTEVFNITMPVMGLTPPLSSEEREMVRRALIGSYTCTASNIYGSDTATTNFRMCGDSPAFPGCSAPIIFVADGGTAPVGCNVCIPEGSSVTLDCTVSVGTPPITYAWSGPPDGNVISSQPRLTVNTQGDYNCNASNLDGPSGAMSANVIVFSPAIKFSGQTTDIFGHTVPGSGCGRLHVLLSASETPDMCVFVGEILNLTCLDSENRPLNTTLMNGNIFTSPTLITRDNAGILNTTYRCSPNTDDVCGQAAETISVFVSDCPIGSYFAETSNRAAVCRPCPQNSISTSSNSHVCMCLQGYYRNRLEDIHIPCTRPPSACRNLRVYHPRTRANTITLRWDRPLITGRDDYHYNIYYSNPDIPGNFTRHNRNSFIKDSSVVQYSVSGLRPLTNYTIRVTVHNGVSDQDPGGEQRRWCEVSGVTGDIRVQAPRNVTSFCSVIVWKAPSRAYGVITGYHISFFLPGRNESVLVRKNRDEFFHAVKEEGGDAQGQQFMVRAVTASTINGTWSEPISLDCPLDPACP